MAAWNQSYSEWASDGGYQCTSFSMFHPVSRTSCGMVGVAVLTERLSDFGFSLSWRNCSELLMEVKPIAALVQRAREIQGLKIPNIISLGMGKNFLLSGRNKGRNQQMFSGHWISDKDFLQDLEGHWNQSQRCLEGSQKRTQKLKHMLLFFIFSYLFSSFLIFSLVKE